MKTNLEQRQLTRREIKDLRVLIRFTEVYCRVHHRDRDRHPLQLPEDTGLDAGRFRYCDECAAFLDYAVQRRLRCPLDPKPACKHCPVHCYKPQMRQRVREVMRFAGPYLMKRGRLDLLWHYLF